MVNQNVVDMLGVPYMKSMYACTRNPIPPTTKGTGAKFLVKGFQGEKKVTAVPRGKLDDNFVSYINNFGIGLDYSTVRDTNPKHSGHKHIRYVTNNLFFSNINAVINHWKNDNPITVIIEPGAKYLETLKILI